MSTSEERLKILTMIQEGKLTPGEGIKLLETLDLNRPELEKNAASTAAPSTPLSAGKTPRWLRVCVTDTDTGKVRVNIRLPISVVTAGMKMGARFSPEVEGLNMDQLMEFVRSGEIGKVVDVFDEEDGEHVEVFVE
jgi:hypothetical protein